MELHEDLYAGDLAGRLVEEGYYEKEYMFYGCGYKKNEKIEYFLTENDMEIYDFIDDAHYEGVLTTPILSMIERITTNDQAEENIIEQVKERLIEKISAVYTKEYMQAVEHWLAIPNNNHGKEIIEQYKNQMPEQLSKHEVDKFLGLVTLAYDGKVLDQEQFEQYSEEGKQMLAKVNMEEPGNYMLMRSYYGFGYTDENGNYQYSFNARKSICLEQKKQYENQCLLTTPMITENYYFYNFDHRQIKVIKEQFEVLLQQELTESYMNYVAKIKEVPSVIDKNEFIEQLEQLKGQLDTVAYDDLIGYGFTWNVFTREELRNSNR